MAEVLVEFEKPVVAPDGGVYRAQACGAPAADGTNHWEGWIEFLPIDGGTPLRSRRETTQPNRTDTHYWATGLSAVYLEGSLKRTLEPPAQPPTRAPRAPEFEGPAQGVGAAGDPAAASVLNPFSVYRKGEALLRDQLSALSPWHLANIIRAHGLSEIDSPQLERMPAAELVELIVAEVRAQAR